MNKNLLTGGNGLLKDIRENILFFLLFALLGVALIVTTIYNMHSARLVLMLLVLGTAIISVVFSSTKIAVMILLFLGFVGHSIIQFGAPEKFIYLWDLVLLLLVLKSMSFKLLSGKPIVITGLMPVIGLCLVTFLSKAVNNTPIVNMCFFLRYMLSGYLIFFSLMNLKLNNDESRDILRFIVVLFLIQLPVSVIKLILFGQGEQSVGTFGFSPGELGVLVPLVAISFMIGFLIYTPGWKKRYIFLILGFIGFSLIAEKRAFIFFLPMNIAVIYFLSKSSWVEKIKYLTLSIPVFMIIGFGVVKLNPTLNPTHQIGGTFDPAYIYNYVKSYVNTYDKYGNSSGRFASTIRTIENLKSSPVFFLLGDGPGTFINSGFIGADMSVSKFKYRIEDGVTGFVWVALQIGVLGFGFLLLFILQLLVKIRRVYMKTSSNFLQIYGLGLLGAGFVFLLDICIYSKAYLAGRNLSLVFFVLTAIYLKYGRGELRTKQMINSGEYVSH